MSRQYCRRQRRWSW